MIESRQVPIVRWSKLLWVPVALSIAATFYFVGTPHLLWSFVASGETGNRYYHRCLYIGRETQLVFPTDGDCSYMRLLKAPQGDRP